MRKPYIACLLLVLLMTTSFCLENGSTQTEELTICSFNIQFLGHFTKKDNQALAGILKDFDIVVVQELVAPPADGTYPDGTAYTADAQARAFFEAMKPHSFDYLLSEEDTGTNPSIHNTGPATEWWTVFYKPDKVDPAGDLPSGFLAADRSDHPEFERVPHAFSFRTKEKSADFVLISVHLQPGDGSADAARRKQELTAVGTWIDSNDEKEKDFIILGDMNIYSAEELATVTPEGYLSLNDECRVTITNQPPEEKGLPYDHAMYNPNFSEREIDTAYDFKVIDLIEAMRSAWTSSEPYPGEPYDHNLFRQYYSDHHPVVFRMTISGRDDD